jgi:hypothetical protein
VMLLHPPLGRKELVSLWVLSPTVIFKVALEFPFYLENDLNTLSSMSKH